MSEKPDSSLDSSRDDDRPAHADRVVAAPPSKSHALRMLALAALAGGESVLRGLQEAPDDVRAMIAALRALGIDVRDDGSGVIRVHGCAGRLPRDTAELDVGGSGTALRLVAALCALGRGPYRIDGDASLRGRPFGGLAGALEELGARVETTLGNPPVTVSRAVGGFPATRRVSVDASRSSQGLSALAVLGAALAGGLEVRSEGSVVSSGYVDLTLGALGRCGVRAERQGGPDGSTVVRVRGGPPSPVDLAIDGDWSSAAYLLALGPVTGRAVVVGGLSEARASAAVQPDARIVHVLRSFGAEVSERADGVRAAGRLVRPIDVDLGGAPDLAPLVGALACLVEGATTVRGAAHLRLKESDRIAAVVHAARALGCTATERDDGFVVVGPAHRSATIEVCGDHRLAMAFAVVGAALPGLRVDDTACVAKSYPGFWGALDRLQREAGGASVEVSSP